MKKYLLIIIGILLILIVFLFGKMNKNDNIATELSQLVNKERSIAIRYKRTNDSLNANIAHKDDIIEMLENNIETKDKSLNDIKDKYTAIKNKYNNTTIIEDCYVLNGEMINNKCCLDSTKTKDILKKEIQLVECEETNDTLCSLINDYEDLVSVQKDKIDLVEGKFVNADKTIKDMHTQSINKDLLIEKLVKKNKKKNFWTRVKDIVIIGLGVAYLAK
jgi:type II secretory pathway pseudopilin PulG